MYLLNGIVQYLPKYTMFDINYETFEIIIYFFLICLYVKIGKNQEQSDYTSYRIMLLACHKNNKFIIIINIIHILL